MAALMRSLCFITVAYVESPMSAAFLNVLGWTCLWSFSTTSEKIFSVDLWRLDTLMRAASKEKSGCCVAMYAAVCAASSSSSCVVTPSYTPWITFCVITFGLMYLLDRP